MLAGGVPMMDGLRGVSKVGEKVEGSLAHLLVLGFGVGVAGKRVIGGKGRSSSSGVAGEGVPVARGSGSWAPEQCQVSVFRITG